MERSQIRGVVAPWLHDTACVMSGLAPKLASPIITEPSADTAVAMDSVPPSSMPRLVGEVAPLVQETACRSWLLNSPDQPTMTAPLAEMPVTPEDWP